MTPRTPSSIPRLWPFKRTYYGWAIVATTFLVSFAQVPMYGPILAVFVRPIGDDPDLGWSRTTIALAFTIGTLMGAVFSASLGALIDRRGGRGLMVVAGIVISGCLIGLSVMTQAWHFWALFGIGRGMAMVVGQVATHVAIASWFIRKRGRALAFRGIGARVGQAILPLIIHIVIVAYSWRHAYAGLAGVSFLLMVLPAALFMRRRPEDMGLLPDGEARQEPGALPRPSEAAASWGEESFTLREALHTRALWLITLSVGVGLFAMGGVNLHMVANFQDQGISAGLAVSVISIFAAVSAVAIVPAGFLLERVHVRFGTMLVAATMLVAMGIAVVADTYLLAVLFSVVLGIGGAGWIVVQGLLFADYFGRRHLGSIRGFASPITGGVSTIGPVAAGLIRDGTGSYTAAYLTFAGLFVLIILAMLWATPPQKRPAPAPST